MQSSETDNICALIGSSKETGLAEVVADMQTEGTTPPAALADRRYSGEFKVRIPPQVHRDLVLSAAEQGVSLNRLASAKLAAA